MTMKHVVTLAVLAVATALPSTAAAVLPPKGDAYLDAIVLNDETHPLKYDEGRFYQADTSTYTVQDDMYDPCNADDPSLCGGGPQEPIFCPNPGGATSEYGNTVWSIFYANRWGRMTIRTSTAPFDSVIGIIPFRSFDNAIPDIPHGDCFDDNAGFEERAAFIIVPGQWYAIQVGDTPPHGGPMQVSYKLRKPAPVGGADTKPSLFWKLRPLRVTRMYVTNVPRGARIKLSCTKHACRKRSFRVKRKVVAAFKPTAHAARKRVNLLKNKKVKRGAKIVLRISSFGHIGRYYRWTVKRSKITGPTVRCMKPASSKPRKKCSG